jgi:hypothetical protein
VADSNRSEAVAQARSAVTANYHLGGMLSVANVRSVRAGQYVYNVAANPHRFEVAYPESLGTGQSWTAVEVVLGAEQPTYFMRVMGVTSMPTGARAVAVHRPRDIALVLDMTGSMGYGSLTNLAVGLNDPSTLFPAFGHYHRYAAYQTANPYAAEADPAVGNRPHPFRQTGVYVSAPYVYAPANLTVETPNGRPIVRDFFYAYTPANTADPSVPVPAVTVSPDGTTNLRRAFHRWSPPESGANPTNYVGPTYDFAGYDPLHTGSEPNPRGPTPAPASFADQSDGPVPYAGDRHPRKRGAAGPAWDPADPGGAAVTAAEYLGWVNAYNGAGILPTLMQPTSGGPDWTGRNWANFRDVAWERYGYDLDVAYYTANRGDDWDPRWDWDLASQNWRHTGEPPDTSFRPRLKPPAERFRGYSMGPGYFGKTFFVWPPDPRAPVGNPGDANYAPGDWRRRFFFNRAGAAFNPQADNDPVAGGSQGINQSLFANGAGPTLRSPMGKWQVNYTAVLKWVKSGPMVLPPNLRSGRVLYYSSIPDTVVAAVGDPDEVKADKLFWKNYIDYVLYLGMLAGSEPVGWPEGVTPGVHQGPLGGFMPPPAGALPPDPWPYMCYTDNPSRPRLHFWFGPLTMLMFLKDYNMWSGTAHQAQCWQLKAGVSSALDDVRNNHPNDCCGLAYFTIPYYNSVVVPMGQDYATLKNALFFPRSLLPDIPVNPAAEWRPYAGIGMSTTNGNIPNAQNQTDANTGLSLAFNLLSASPAVNPDPLRRGRRGAAKIVVFETDGIPNATQRFTLNRFGYDSYYSFAGGSDPAGPHNAAYAVVDQIVKPVGATNAAGTDGGHSLPNAPARVYAIGFGDIFSTAQAGTATEFLLEVQKRGNTSRAADTVADFPARQIITGPYQVRIANLRDALERILQSGVQVTLVE